MRQRAGHSVPIRRSQPDQPVPRAPTIAQTGIPGRAQRGASPTTITTTPESGPTTNTGRNVAIAFGVGLLLRGLLR